MAAGALRALALAVALVLLLAALAAAVPSVPRRGARLLRARRRHRRARPRLPAPRPGGRSSSAAAEPRGVAPSRLRALRPAALGAPEGVSSPTHAGRRAHAGLSAVARPVACAPPPARLLVSQFRGDIHPEYARKIVPRRPPSIETALGGAGNLDRGRPALLLLPRPRTAPCVEDQLRLARRAARRARPAAGAHRGRITASGRSEIADSLR